MRKYRNYSDEDVIRLAKEVKSIAGLLRALDLKPIGGNYVNIKKILQNLNVDTSHWTGKAWSKGQQLKDWSKYCKPSSFKRQLINKRGHQCEKCKATKWFEDLITLEIHHVDGNRGNNKEDNLQLLCPNCHSYTDNWRNPKW